MSNSAIKVCLHIQTSNNWIDSGVITQSYHDFGIECRSHLDCFKMLVLLTLGA